MNDSRRKLAIVLSLLFLLALVLGPGPGLRLVNPNIEDPNARYTVMGLPIIYAWGLLWYAVQLIILLIAYCKLWNEPEDQACGADSHPN